MRPGRRLQEGPVFMVGAGDRPAWRQRETERRTDREEEDQETGDRRGVRVFPAASGGGSGQTAAQKTMTSELLLLVILKISQHPQLLPLKHTRFERGGCVCRLLPPAGCTAPLHPVTG